MSPSIRLKNLDENRNYFLKEIEKNEFTSKKLKICETLNYIDNFFILASTITGCISISPFAFFAWYLSSAIGLKIFAIAPGIKKV